MSPLSKREYREAVHVRYKNATRNKKTAILDEFCAICGCQRIHAIRVIKRFKRFTKPKEQKRGKPSVYQNKAVRKPLTETWLKVNLPCSKRLKAILPRIWSTRRRALYGCCHCLTENLTSNYSRILKPIRIHYTKRGRSTTKPGTLLRKQAPLPIKTN
jgi:hypothetical protein